MISSHIFFPPQINAHLQTLQTCLTTLMGHAISMEQLKLDVGLMVEKMTQITIMFRRIKLRMEEYVCLKVYILLNKGKFNEVRVAIQVLTLDLFYRSRIRKYSRAIRSGAEKLPAAHITTQSREIRRLISTHSRGKDTPVKVLHS